MLGNEHPQTQISIDNPETLYRQQKYEEATRATPKRRTRTAIRRSDRTTGHAAIRLQPRHDLPDPEGRRACLGTVPVGADGFRVAYGESIPTRSRARTNLTGTLFRLSRWAEIETHLFAELRLLETRRRARRPPRVDHPGDRHPVPVLERGRARQRLHDAKSAEWVQRLEDFRTANAEPAS